MPGMNTSVKHKPARATQLWFSDQKLYVRLEDGREIAAPLEWFPKLREASQHDLNEWRFIGNGMAFIGNLWMKMFLFKDCCISFPGSAHSL